MGNEDLRHVIVEAPDGSMVVGVNPEIEPPVVQEVVVRIPRNATTRIYVKYNEITIALIYLHLYFSIASVIFRTSVIDILNTLFLVCIIPIVHASRLEGRLIIIMYSSLCFISVPVFVYFYLWLYTGYFFSLGIHLLITFYWSKIYTIT